MQSVWSYVMLPSYLIPDNHQSQIFEITLLLELQLRSFNVTLLLITVCYHDTALKSIPLLLHHALLTRPFSARVSRTPEPME